MKFLALSALFFTQLSFSNELNCSSELMKLSIQLRQKGDTLSARLYRRADDKKPFQYITLFTGEIVPQTVVQGKGYLKASYDLLDIPGNKGALTIIKEYNLINLSNPDLPPEQKFSAGLTYKNYVQSFVCAYK